MNRTSHTLGILCGGGPAPGINSVISSATIEAINSGWKVLGFRDGFEHLVQGRTDEVMELTIADVSRIPLLGGSILSISRASLTREDPDHPDPKWRVHNCIRTLQELGVDALMTIGGDGTAYAANHLARESGGAFKIAHIPKTIDNDLPLPSGQSTFGFETARHVGVHIVNNMMRDAMTTRRWFVIVAMGRSAGHLALGIAKASGATLAVIAEEFPADQPVPLSQVVDILETAMFKRAALGRPFGVAIVSEGLALRLDQDELAAAEPELEHDQHGNLRLSEVHLHRILTRLLKRRFRERGQEKRIVAKTIGYELRCAPPIPFDIDYTKDLGHGAIQYLRRQLEATSAEPGAMITIERGELTPVPLGSFTDPDTGYTQVRQVDTSTESYQVAWEYMIRLKQEDFSDADLLTVMATEAQLSPEEFRERYGYLVAAR